MTCSKGPQVGLEPGPLRQGHSHCTLVACSICELTYKKRMKKRHSKNRIVTDYITRRKTLLYSLTCSLPPALSHITVMCYGPAVTARVSV